MFQFARPSIPLGLLHDIVAITPSETFSQANGGQFIPGAKPAETTFKGVIMPVNNEDLQYAPAGTYTHRTATSSTPTARALPSASRYATPTTAIPTP